MTDTVLVLAWLVLAHIVADFVFQTSSIVRAKNGRGSAAAGGLLAHGLIVAICLVPVGLAFGAAGWTFLAWSAGLHVVIDRTKIVLTRRSAARALADAHARREGPQPADHLGRAWTAAPAALFLADQLAHLGVLVVGWAAWLVVAQPQTSWVDGVNGVLGSLDRSGVHHLAGALVVGVTLAIVNIRAASIFVSILVRPVEEAEGETHWGERTGGHVDRVEAAEPARRWSVRIGPIDARIDAVAEPRSMTPAPAPTAPALAARVGATIGVLERLLVVVFVLAGTDVAIGFVVAAKTLARFRQLDDREFAEYYLLGTLASVAVAIVTALVGRTALGVLLG